MLNRIIFDPIWQDDRRLDFGGSDVYLPYERIDHPELEINTGGDYTLPYTPIERPQLEINKTAQYKFVDAATGKLLTHVQIIDWLKGLGFSSSNGTASFSYTEAGKTYTAKANGYDPVSFKPVAGKTITVYLRKTVKKTAHYKFIDSATGKTITGVSLSPQSNVDIIRDITDFSDPRNLTLDNGPGSYLKGLGAPTYSNGVFTFPETDFNKRYNVKATGYNTTNVLVADHKGVITIKLSPIKATVKFVDSATKKPITGVTVSTGLNRLLGLGVNYRNNGGVFDFTFAPTDNSQLYTVSAKGYKSKQILVIPNDVTKIIKLEKIVVKAPPIETGDSDMATRLRLAKAKAIARIRKIKLLAI